MSKLQPLRSFTQVFSKSEPKNKGLDIKFEKTDFNNSNNNLKVKINTSSVQHEDVGIRLDRWFKRHFPNVPFVRVAKLLREGKIKIANESNRESQSLDNTIKHSASNMINKDGTQVNIKRQKATISTRLERNQIITYPNNLECDFHVENHQNYTNNILNSFHEKKQKQLMQLLQDNIIYTDNNLIVINKPYNLPTQDGPGIKFSVDSLSSALEDKIKSYTKSYTKNEVEKNVVRPKIVHRLDRNTTGALMLARTAYSAAILSDIIRSRKLHKLYLAIVAGIPIGDSGYIDLPLLKSENIVTQHTTSTLIARRMLNKTQSNIMMNVDFKNGLEAITKYRVLSISDTDNVSLVLFKILTGRMHQIRAHCAAIQCPIFGDRKYTISLRSNIMSQINQYNFDNNDEYDEYDEYDDHDKYNDYETRNQFIKDANIRHEVSMTMRQRAQSYTNMEFNNNNIHNHSIYDYHVLKNYSLTSEILKNTNFALKSKHMHLHALQINVPLIDKSLQHSDSLYNEKCNEKYNEGYNERYKKNDSYPVQEVLAPIPEHFIDTLSRYGLIIPSSPYHI